MTIVIHGKSYTEVTAMSVGNYRHIDEFFKKVNSWLDEHNISYRWLGHNTTTLSGGTRIYTYTFGCNNEKDAVFAALRWM
jgi:hypothetical protein